MPENQSSDSKIFENIKCIVCQNRNFERFRVRFTGENWAVVECLNCHFHFIPPFFRRQIDYSDYKSGDVTSEIKKSNQWIKLQRNFLRFQLIRKYKKGGKLLDVGVGFGHFLLAGKQLGYEIAGIEMSRANVEFVQRELNLPVAFGDFLEMNETEKYDIITFWDVLEHIDQADRVIEKTARLMNSGGFVFLQVPQWGSFFQKMMQNKWWAMGLDHVNYFSRKTITRLLSTYGFKVRKIKSSIELKNIFTYVILPKLKQKKKSQASWTTVERQQAFNKLTRRPQWLLWLMVKAHNLVYKTLSLLRIDDEMIVVAEKM